MQEHTLTVPAEYAEDFRAAIVAEIAFDARGVQSERKTLAEAVERRSAVADARASDLGTTISMLERSVALANAVGLAALDTPSAPSALEVGTDDVETLAHVCEVMARQIVGPKLIEELDVGPIDNARDLDQLLSSLRWAVDQAVELHAAYARERGWEVAA